MYRYSWRFKFCISPVDGMAIFIKIEKKSSKEAGLLLSLLIFYLIHMCAEGYIFAAGSFAFFYFWLLLGTIQAYSIQQSDLVTQKNIQSAQT